MKTENELREHIKTFDWGDIIRLESKSGGDFGLPDLMIVGSMEKIAFAELKIASVATQSNFHLSVSHRPAQLRTLSKLLDYGFAAFYLFSTKDSNQLFVFNHFSKAVTKGIRLLFPPGLCYKVDRDTDPFSFKLR